MNPGIEQRELPIRTQRFFLRPLVTGDASEKYLSWLQEESTRQFIVAARDTSNLPALRACIEQKSGRPDVLFLGIFHTEDGRHLGNLKYEPIDTEAGFAIVGIMVGDPDWRGKGVATEAIDASVSWLIRHRGIGEFVLDVKRANVAAIRAYEKAGFNVEHTDRIRYDPETSITMVRRA
jgi:RimJ/RimL family protein N-acetyltransferase